MNGFLLFLTTVALLRAMLCAGNWISASSSVFRSTVTGINPLTASTALLTTVEVSFGFGTASSKVSFDTSTTPTFVQYLPSVIASSAVAKCGSAGQGSKATWVASLVALCALCAEFLVMVALVWIEDDGDRGGRGQGGEGESKERSTSSSTSSRRAVPMMKKVMIAMLMLLAVVGCAASLAATTWLFQTRACVETSISNVLRSASYDLRFTFSASMASWSAFVYLILSSLAVAQLSLVLQWVTAGKFGPNLARRVSSSLGDDATTDDDDDGGATEDPRSFIAPHGAAR